MKFLTPSHRVLYQALTSEKKRKAVLIIGLSVVAAVAEVASIGALVPFIGLITNPSLVTSNPLVAEAMVNLSITEDAQVIGVFAAIFCIVVMVSGGLRYALLWTQTEFSFSVGADLVERIYQRTLHKNYQHHLNENSSDVVAALTVKARDVVNQTITPVITLISSALLLITIACFFIYLDPEVALWAFVLFGSLYVTIAINVRAVLARAGVSMTENQNRIVKILQESLGAIRHVLADSLQRYFLDRFVLYDREARKAVVKITVISQAPRYIVESVGLVIVALLAYVLVAVLDRADDAIITLGALALGAQRMMPMLQQAYWSYSQLMGGFAAVKDVAAMLSPSEMMTAEEQRVNFEDTVEFFDLKFKYANKSNYVLSDVNLKIKSGQRIGIVGETGSGKSTLVDIVMGLLSPSGGKIQIDGVDMCSDESLAGWRRNISHVPQDVYLCDGTISENIALGMEAHEIDMGAVSEVVQVAQLSDLIARLPDGLNTLVGERGSSLSGGQRQRIGIARALYKRKPILILDEATSALDQQTETKIMEQVEGFCRGVTVLMIAHRTDTLRNCDEIWQVKDSNVRVYKNIREYLQS